ncbi:MAG: hypothetical protein PVJ69_13735 [Desulfobacteraceae bacterium]
MKEVVDLEKARLELAVKKAYRNWESKLGESFELKTQLSHLSPRSLAFLAQGKEKSPFYLYDLIMNLLNLGSGFEFNELHSKQKMAVVDRYLFILDRIRFEYMKRLGWLESYPGEECTLVDFVIHFEELAPSLQTKTPILSQKHPEFESFSELGAFEKEEFIRKLIPKALREMEDEGDSVT